MIYLKDCNGAKEVTVKERNEWYKDVKKKLCYSEQNFYYFHCGDSIVIGVRYDNGEVSIFDAKVRRKAEYKIKNLKIKEN